MKRDQKGSSSLLIIIAVIVVLAVAGFYLLKSKTTIPSSYQLPQPSQPTGVSQTQSIQNDKDLTNTTNDLDNANVDAALDPELNQNDTDAQTFAPRIRLKNGTSLNWAGYAIESNLTNPQNHVVNDVKGSWTVPSVTCSSTNTYSATWIGIDGYSDNTIEQTGTEQDCINGKPQYSAWYELYPKPSYRVSLTVNPGDIMSGEVKYIGNNKFTLTLTDVTTNKSFSITQKSSGLRQSAEWIVEAPWSGSILPLANFGTQYFTNASAILGTTTGTISNGSWQNDAITMTSSSGTPKATPSALSGDGSSFSVAWNAN